MNPKGRKLEDIQGVKLVDGKGHVVWYVDESEFEHVGYSTPAFIANDRASIQAMKKYLGKGRIESNTTVMSWW